MIPSSFPLEEALKLEGYKTEYGSMSSLCLLEEALKLEGYKTVSASSALAEEELLGIP